MNATCENLAYQIDDYPSWQCDFEHENLKIFKSNELTHNNISVNCELKLIPINGKNLPYFVDDTCYLNIFYVNVWLFQKETQFLYFNAPEQIGK